MKTYRLRQDKRICSGHETFERVKGSLVTVEQADSQTNKLLVRFGDHIGWFHESILDDLEPVEASLNASSNSILEELSDLLELVDKDGRIHDLDQQDYDSLSTLGQVLLELMLKYSTYKDALELIVLDAKTCRETSLGFGDRAEAYAETAGDSLNTTY